MTATWLERRRTRIDDIAGGRSLGAEAFRRLRREPAAIVGAVIIGIFVVVAAFAPLLAPHDATDGVPRSCRRTCVPARSRDRRKVSRWAATSSGATSSPG